MKITKILLWNRIKAIRQYTGKKIGYKDKNGKEIYEGDELKITDDKGTHTMKVFFFPACYSNQKNEYVIESLFATWGGGPGYWYYVDEIDTNKSWGLKTEQIERISEVQTNVLKNN